MRRRDALPAQRSAAAAAVRRRRPALAEDAERLRVVEHEIAAVLLDASQHSPRPAPRSPQRGQKPSATTIGTPGTRRPRRSAVRARRRRDAERSHRHAPRRGALGAPARDRIGSRVHEILTGRLPSTPNRSQKRCSVEGNRRARSQPGSAARSPARRRRLPAARSAAGRPGVSAAHGRSDALGWRSPR